MYDVPTHSHNVGARNSFRRLSRSSTTPTYILSLSHIFEDYETNSIHEVIVLSNLQLNQGGGHCGGVSGFGEGRSLNFIKVSDWNWSITSDITPYRELMKL